MRDYKNEAFRNLPNVYKNYVKSANKRGYSMNLDYDYFIDLVTMPCYYCDYYLEEHVNGIDRVNNSKPYTKENCVPCCEICNRIKYTYHPMFFLEKSKFIGNNMLAPPQFFSKYKEYYIPKTTHVDYTTYKNITEQKRNIKFNITPDEWNTLIYNPCYICGYKDPYGIGIDRVDNSIREYTIDNCKPCCSSCNFMKSTLKLEDIKITCNRIANKWPDISIFNNLDTFNAISLLSK